ncbi:MAG: hypothetical protein WAV79_12730, partial [Anaerolineae bacterium]
ITAIIIAPDGQEWVREFTKSCPTAIGYTGQLINQLRICGSRIKISVMTPTTPMPTISKVLFMRLFFLVSLLESLA